MELNAPDLVDAARTYALSVQKMEQALQSQESLAGDQLSLADCAMVPDF
jgi:glutathione S-transferase